MEKMGELGDLGWELRSLEAFLQPSWAVEQRRKGLPKGIGSQPLELSCITPAVTARLPNQSFNLSGFSYLIQMKGIRCVHTCAKLLVLG